MLATLPYRASSGTHSALAQMASEAQRPAVTGCDKNSLCRGHETIVRAPMIGHGGHTEHPYQALPCATHGHAHAGVGRVDHGKEPRMAVYRGREGVNTGVWKHGVSAIA